MLFSLSCKCNGRSLYGAVVFKLRQMKKKKSHVMVVCVKLMFHLNLTWPLMVMLRLTKSLMGFGGCFRRGRHERHGRQMGGKYIK